jgi:predicted N-acetyltransferase YhbS
MANANPETLLQHDRRTGGWLFASELRRSGSYEVALRAAARFYRRFGFALAAFAGLACVFGAVLLVV